MANHMTNPIQYLQEFCQNNNITSFPRYFEGSYELKNNRLGLPVLYFCKCNFDEYTVTRVSVKKEQAKFAAAHAMIDFLNETHYFDKFVILPNDNEAFELNGEPEHATRSPISDLEQYCTKFQLYCNTHVEDCTQGNSGYVAKLTVGVISTTGKGINKPYAKRQAAAKMCDILLIPLDDCRSENDISNPQISSTENTNAVTVLKDFCQFRGFNAPTYEVDLKTEVKEVVLPDGLQAELLKITRFTTVCKVGGILLGIGSGKTEEKSKIYAAKQVLLALAKSAVAADILEFMVLNNKRWAEASKLALTALCFCYRLVSKQKLKHSCRNKKYVVEITVGSVTGKGRSTTVGPAKSFAAQEVIETLLQELFPGSTKTQGEAVTSVKPDTGRVV